MTRVIIARHGNTFNPGDVVTRVGARTDMPLTTSGREQAVALGKYFFQKGLSFDAVFCSCLQRTKETAVLALAETGVTLEPEVLSFLREIDYGPDENIAEDIVRQRIGAKALEDWEKAGIPPQGWLVNPEDLKQDWKNFLDRVAADYKGQTLLVVTSNGIARFALQAISDTSDYALKLKTGAYGEINVTSAGHYEITTWNVRP